MTSEASVGPRLKLLTWNLWFSDFERDRRFEAVLAVLRAERPDVVSLQEVLPETLARLVATPWVQAEYRLSDTTGETLDRYGTVVLTRLEPTTFQVLELPSRMGRKLVVVDLDVDGVRLRVAGMHLESLESIATRRAQLEQIFPYLAEAEAAVLMGDMNFDAGDPEQREVPKDFVDLWPALYPEERGATRDLERNAMAARFAYRPDARRLDRVFFYAGATGWRPEAVRLLGVTPLAGSPEVYPSDHFGLVATLVRAPGAHH